ncbi:MAG TPA: multicopper oxidase domain-containing protein [Amycolatopsis sp.]|nr:multicopper oxidase domain-containing protein [Amycolatopsis sp.]
MTDVITQPAPVATPAGPNWGLTKFLDPLRIPRVIRPHSWWHADELTVTMTNTRVSLHSQLPETAVWAYEGQFPGPTIEVRRGKLLRVAWTNEIDGTIPLVAVQQTIPAAGGVSPVATPGYRNPDGSLRDGVSIIDGVSVLPAWTVVHLHGALTNGGHDGWAHNAVLKGLTQLTEYKNDQQATSLWYHDHGMAVTRFNVHAGLAGMYLIRDDEEDELDLPGGEYEIPLVLSDRNLDTDPATGALTGQMLFKVLSTGTATVPFTGPFNLVNGVIWPHLEVAPRWYRFRVLNASNSRFYQLRLADDAGTQQSASIRIIGTDGGLLPAPAPLPADGLTLAPAERADLLIDFSGFAGQNLRLTDAGAQGTEPDLMQFRVESRGRQDGFRLPEKLSTSYVRLQHGTTVPEDHDHVFVALIPPNTMGDGHPQLWELEEIVDAPVPDGEGIIQLRDPSTGDERTFQMVASMFDDMTSFFINHDRWAVWNFVHLGGPTHPMHIHMTEFQLLTRKKFATDPGTGNVVNFDPQQGRTTAVLETVGDGRPIEQYEEGWKDTFQVAAGEWVTVAGHFAGATGEFMYHCHILDHEDDGMMRPFVVHPPEVAHFHMHHGSAGHSGH